MPYPTIYFGAVLTKQYQAGPYVPEGKIFEPGSVTAQLRLPTVGPCEATMTCAPETGQLKTEVTGTGTYHFNVTARLDTFEVKDNTPIKVDDLPVGTLDLKNARACFSNANFKHQFENDIRELGRFYDQKWKDCCNRSANFRLGLQTAFPPML